jgi:hypothetical protein
MDLKEAETAFKKNWVGLIQKIYEVDLLVCPKLILSEGGISGGHAGYRLF